MLRALGGLPGGLGRFLPCRLSANHCRLRSISWERCGHTSRPLEASGTGFLDDLLSLFGYPSGSGQSLLDGSLRMRYCSTIFSSRKPTWKLSPFGGVAVLVAAVAVPPLEAGLRDFHNTREVLEKVEERRYDLPKRQMFVSVLGLILGRSQFPNDGRLTL